MRRATAPSFFPLFTSPLPLAPLLPRVPALVALAKFQLKPRHTGKLDLTFKSSPVGFQKPSSNATCALREQFESRRKLARFCPPLSYPLTQSRCSRNASVVVVCSASELPGRYIGIVLVRVSVTSRELLAMGEQKKFPTVFIDTRRSIFHNDKHCCSRDACTDNGHSVGTVDIFTIVHPAASCLRRSRMPAIPGTKRDAISECFL